MKSIVYPVEVRSELRSYEPCGGFVQSTRSAHHTRTSGWVLASVALLLSGCGGSDSSGQGELDSGESGNPTASLCDRSLCDADYDECVSRDEYANCIADCECYALEGPSYRGQCELLCENRCSSREPDEVECRSQRATCRRTARDAECESMGAGGGLGTSGATGDDAGTGGTGATGGVTATGGAGEATGGAAATGGTDEESADGSGETAAGNGGGSGSGGAGTAWTWPDTVDELLRECDFSLECMSADYGLVSQSEIRRERGGCVLFVPNVTTSLLADGKTGEALYSGWHITDAGLSVCREDASGWCKFQCGPGTPPVSHCTGTPSDCSAIPTDVCTGIAGCAVVDAVCKGTAWPCRGYVDATQCRAAGCDWNEQ